VSGGPVTIGVISDTHGLVRPAALAALRGCAVILHAGDVGAPSVLDALRALAPVFAVRGNCDRGDWGRALPASETVEVAGVLIHVLHDRHDLDLAPRAAGLAAVVSGHTHRPALARRDGVLYVNPGSAGPRRFDLPVSVARLAIADGRVEGAILELEG